MADKPGPPPMPKSGRSRGFDTGSPEIDDPSRSKPPPRASQYRGKEHSSSCLTLFLTGMVIVISPGLVIPKSVLFTVPILAMFGLWCILIGFSNPGRNTRYSFGLIFAGLSPIALILIGLPPLFYMHSSTADFFVRLLLVGYGILLAPILFFIQWKEGFFMWVTAKAVGVGCLILLSLNAMNFLATSSTVSKKQASNKNNIPELTQKADDLWRTEQRIQAVQLYKKIIRSQDDFKLRRSVFGGNDPINVFLFLEK